MNLLASYQPLPKEGGRSEGVGSGRGAGVMLANSTVLARGRYRGGGGGGVRDTVVVSSVRRWHG